MNHTKSRRASVYARDGNKCVYCGKGESLKNPLTLDHKTPVSKGGKHTFENLVTCCASCNQRKGNLSFEEWMAKQAAAQQRKESRQQRQQNRIAGRTDTDKNGLPTLKK